MTIELGTVRRVLHEVDSLVESLDGEDLIDTEALTSQSSGEVRRQKAKKAQDLQLLANRLELAAQLVRVEYWHSRGKGDPLSPGRTL